MQWVNAAVPNNIRHSRGRRQALAEDVSEAIAESVQGNMEHLIQQVMAVVRVEVQKHTKEVMRAAAAGAMGSPREPEEQHSPGLLPGRSPERPRRASIGSMHRRSDGYARVPSSRDGMTRRGSGKSAFPSLGLAQIGHYRSYHRQQTSASTAAKSPHVKHHGSQSTLGAHHSSSFMGSSPSEAQSVGASTYNLQGAASASTSPVTTSQFPNLGTGTDNFPSERQMDKMPSSDADAGPIPSVPQPLSPKFGAHKRSSSKSSSAAAMAASIEVREQYRADEALLSPVREAGELSNELGSPGSPAHHLSLDDDEDFLLSDLAIRHTTDERDHSTCCWPKLCRRIARWPGFVTMMDCVILSSAILTGLQVEYMADNLFVIGNRSWLLFSMDLLHYFFVIVFTLEATIWISAQGWEHFTEANWRWNCLDLFLLTLQIGSVFVPDISSAVGLLRLSRFFRTTRKGSLSAYTWELRMLLTSIVGSMKTLGWSLLVLFVFTYMFSVYLTELVITYQQKNRHMEPEQVEILEELYGSVPAAMMTLFQTVSDGIHWHEVMTPLTATISPWLSIGFVVYISIAAFVFVNIIAGVVFESATTTARQDKKAAILEDIKKAFQTLDKDGKGIIYADDFAREVGNNAQMDIHFRALGVAPDQAHELFNLLDNDESGFIDCQEFVEGCHRLQGDVKAIDFASFVNEWRCFCYRVDEHLSFVEMNAGGIWATSTEGEGPRSTHTEIKKSRVQFKHSSMEDPEALARSWALGED
mmetsp:Transcript_31340/g.73077  ORF Transcript_31340/g.73077 Transcript_31340/m.73077 type:complete len:756 (+) Transcript_31340:117-2384(+)